MVSRVSVSIAERARNPAKSSDYSGQLTTQNRVSGILYYSNTRMIT